MDTPAIQRLIDRAHVANNEPARIDAKRAQVELDAMRARMAYALEHGEPKAREAAIKELLAAERSRIAQAIREEKMCTSGPLGSELRFKLNRLLRVVDGDR